jgi:L-rhamnose isomerase
MAERMFAEDSYEDIKTVGEAKQAVLYLAHNESTFIRELQDEGLDYDAIDAEVKKVWLALLKACKRIRFSNYITRYKASLHNFK